MGGRNWWRLGDLVTLVGVLIVGLWVFGGAAHSGAFHGDEGDYILTARYFDYLFVQHDVTRPEWGDGYWTHTQPMLARYLVGGSLWVGGYDLAKVPGRYRWGRSLEENRLEGRVPEAPLLFQARAPMAVMAAGAVGLLYVLGRVLGGPLAGLAAAALALASPFAQQYLVRAVNDAPLVFCLLLGLLLAIVGARRGRAGGLPTRWAVAVGAALGLGLGAKLTAVLSLAAVLGWAALAALLAARRRPASAPGDRLRRAWAAGRGWVLAPVVGVALFVLSDPHLYPNPLLHTAHLFQDRAEEMVNQQRVSPGDALLNPLDRPGYVLGGSLIDGTWTGSHGLPFEALLAGLGGAALLLRTWRGWRQAGLAPVEGFVALTAVVYFAGTSLGLLVPWPNYYLPTLLIGSLLSGLGISAVVRWALAAGGAFQRGSLLTRSDAPVPGQRSA